MRFAVRMLALMALTGCADVTTDPDYMGVATELLDDDLVNFKVVLHNAGNADAVESYARCAAAQYALVRGFSYVRLVRTVVTKRAGTWGADAVYTISSEMPAGLVTIDAADTVATCAASGIPTV